MESKSSLQNVSVVLTRAWAGNSEKMVELDIVYVCNYDSLFVDVLSHGTQVIVYVRNHSENKENAFSRIKVAIDSMQQDMNKLDVYYGFVMSDNDDGYSIAKIGPIYPQNITEIVGCYQE